MPWQKKNVRRQVIKDEEDDNDEEINRIDQEDF
jgi:hypothetical protein